jgi:hypothetical protein
MYYLGLSPVPKKQKAKAKAKPKKIKIVELQKEIMNKLGTTGFYPHASSDDTVIGNEWYHPAGGAAMTKEVASAYAKEYRARIGVPGCVRVRFLEDAHILNKNGKWVEKPAYMIFISEPVLFG